MASLMYFKWRDDLQDKGYFAKVSVEWNYQAPAGGGDTHFSVMQGTKCDLTIRQGAEEKFIPTLYASNMRGASMDEFSKKLKDAVQLFLTIA